MVNLVRNGLKFYHAITALLLILSLFPMFANGQWSDKAIEKVCGDKTLSYFLQQSYHHIVKNLDSAAFYGEKALKKSLDTKNSKATCLSYILLARIDLLTPDYAKALEYVDTATALNSNLKIPELEAYIGYINALKYLMLNNKKEAINEATRVLSIYEQIRDSTGMSSLYKFTGLLYLQSGGPGDLEKSRLYYAKALEILQRQGDFLRVGSIYANISEIFLKSRQFDSANRYIEKAIWYDKLNNNFIWLAADYMGMGEIKSGCGQYDSADYYFLLAGKYFTHPNDKALYYIARGNIAKQRKQYSLAREFFNQGYQLARENKNYNAQLKAADAIIANAELTGDDKTAYTYMKEYSRLKDTLSAAENMPAISLLEIQRAHHLKTKQMQVEQEKIAIASQRKSLYLLFLGIFLFMTILVFLVVIYYLRLRQRAISLEKTVLDNTIELKNKEMTMTLMSMLKKNEMLAGIRQKLLDIRNEEIHDDARESLHRIAQEIEEISDTEIWEEFELRFKQVHSDFYKNLIVKYPDLTAGDMRLCALLRLNLSTKEIAQLTGQGANAIEVGRSRLRKKLGITNPDTNLVAFLSRI